MYLPAYIRDIHGTAFPPNPFERELFYRDDLHQLFYWNGVAWIPAGPGMVPHHLTHELGGADQVMGTVPATPLALVHRDAAGRSQIVNPAVAADIDNMGSRDAAILIETLARALADAMHAAITTPPIHGSTVAAAINTLVHRDAAGRSQIVNPAVAADIDNLGSRNAAIAAYVGVVPCFHVTLSADQVGIVTGTDTKIEFDTEVFDTNNNFANYRFTPTVAGKYLFIASLRIGGMNDGDNIRARVLKNGGIEKVLGMVKSGSGGVQSCGGSCIVEANGSTDFFEMYGYHDFGANRDFSSVASYTFWQGFRIIE